MLPPTEPPTQSICIWWPELHKLHIEQSDLAEIWITNYNICITKIKKKKSFVQILSKTAYYVSTFV